MGVHKPHHHIRLTRETKLDLGVWWEFFLCFNGRSFLNDSFLTGDYLQLYTDAAGGIGYGALCGSEWFCGKWPMAWRLFNVAVLELYPIMAAVHVWGEAWANKSVCFFTDNEALIPTTNNQTSHEPHIMALLRPLVLACLRFNINYAACHIPGRINNLANKLSHLQVDEFRQLGDGQPGSTLQCVPSRLRESLDKLLQALAPSSRAHYECAWKKLVNFHVSLGLPTRLPVSVLMVLLFIAHLYASGSAPASIVSTVSAVAYFHKINGFHDPSNCFMVSKLLAGAIFGNSP